MKTTLLLMFYTNRDMFQVDYSKDISFIVGHSANDIIELVDYVKNDYGLTDQEYLSIEFAKDFLRKDKFDIMKLLDRQQVKFWYHPNRGTPLAKLVANQNLPRMY